MNAKQSLGILIQDVLNEFHCICNSL